MKNIAIIPARSGSKGLPDKNIKILNNRPLMAYSIEAAKKAGIFDEIMVSTDSERYAEIARENGAKVPFLRSDEQSGDKAGSWEVVKEVLQNYKNMGREFDTICLLQPTSPLRISEDIVNAYDVLISKGCEAVSSVCEADHSPLWCMTLEEDMSLKKFREKSQSVPRQQLERYYRMNGAVYIRKIIYGSTPQLLDNEEYAFIMPKERSIDIDTQMDFDMAGFMMMKDLH